MPDQSLDILIRTLAETKGADAVQEALNKVKSEAIAGGKSVEESGEKAGKSFLRASSHGRTFHRVMAFLRMESPLLGTALQLALNPVVGTLFAVIAAFRAGKAAIKEWNDELDAAAERAAKPLGPTAADFQPIIEAVKTATTAFGDSQKALANWATTATTSINAEKAALDALLEAQKQVAVAAAPDEKKAEVRAAFEAAKAGAGTAAKEEEAAVLRQQFQAQQAAAAKQRDIIAQTTGVTGPLTKEETEKQIAQLTTEKANTATRLEEARKARDKIPQKQEVSIWEALAAPFTAPTGSALRRKVGRAKRGEEDPRWTEATKEIGDVITRQQQLAGREDALRRRGAAFAAEAALEENLRALITKIVVSRLESGTGRATDLGRRQVEVGEGFRGAVEEHGAAAASLDFVRLADAIKKLTFYRQSYETLVNAVNQVYDDLQRTVGDVRALRAGNGTR